MNVLGLVLSAGFWQMPLHTVGDQVVALRQYPNLEWKLEIRGEVQRDSVSVSVQSPRHFQATELLPFFGTDKNTVSMARWPNELSDGTSIHLSYIGKNAQGMWTRNSGSYPISTPSHPFQYNFAPGQRFIVQSWDEEKNVLTFLDSNKKPVPVGEIMFRPLVLEKIEPVGPALTRHVFHLESDPKTIYTATTWLPLMHYSNINAIAGTLHGPTKAWYRGRHLPIRDVAGTAWPMIESEDRSMQIQAVYLLAKAGFHSINPTWRTYGYERAGFQPVLVVFDVPKGEVRGGAFSEPISTDDILSIKRVYGPQGMTFPSSADYVRLISNRPPAEDLFPRDSPYYKALISGHLIGGMTRDQVEWVFGPPMSKNLGERGSEQWTYRDEHPAHVITFVNGRAIREYVGMDTLEERHYSMVNNRKKRANQAR